MRQLLTDLRGNPIYQSNGSWRRGTTVWRNPYAVLGGDVQSNPQYNPRSLLFLHVTSSDWNAVIRRAQSHPQEVLMVDDNLNTPLHRACQLDPPVEVVTALQDAATQINGLGATPLHIAASHRCNGRALQAIIDLYKGALSHQSRMGRTPIHYACMSYRGLDLVAFQTLLEATLEESRNILLIRQHQTQLPQQNSDNNNDNNDDDDATTTAGESLHVGGDSNGRTSWNDNNNNITSDGGGEALMIADFIDVLRREHGDNVIGESTIDDEDLSVLVVDDPSTGLAHMSTNDTLTLVEDEDLYDDDDDENNPNKDNSNIVTWKDSTGNTPLSLLFRRYRERVKSVISVLEQMRNNPGSTTPTTSPTSLQTDLGHLWGKARLIVARLTEEQQQRIKESTEARANTVDLQQQQQKDDYSASGSSYGGHLSAAAAWSSERCRSATAVTSGVEDPAAQHPVTNRLSLSPTGFPTTDRQRTGGDENKGTDAETEPSKVSSVQERQFRIVHASVALAGYGCPPEMIRLAISIHPHQVKEMDEDGNLVSILWSIFLCHKTKMKRDSHEMLLFYSPFCLLVSSLSTLQPPPPLLVASHQVLPCPMTRLSSQMGWQVYSVPDPRKGPGGREYQSKTHPLRRSSNCC
jgi:Ankyrin repeats (3 copies)